MFHRGLYSGPFSILFSPLLSVSVWFYRPSLLSDSLLCLLSQSKKGRQGFKAQPFLKNKKTNACFLRFQCSRNGFIVYGENIYKEYNRKKIINFVAAWIWQKPTSEEKLSQKVPVKGLPPSLYENLLFSCDCAMFFKIGYFIWK